jgi:hypothetical protein
MIVDLIRFKRIWPGAFFVVRTPLTAVSNSLAFSAQFRSGTSLVIERNPLLNNSLLRKNWVRFVVGPGNDRRPD